MSMSAVNLTVFITKNNETYLVVVVKAVQMTVFASDELGETVDMVVLML